MQLSVMLEPQEGMRYSEIVAVARHSEALGFEGLYRSDHYKSVQGRDERGSTDAWATLAGLARDTERILLGTMVSPVTFRPAGNLAKVVATVAEMAGPGRVHLGLGTGWLASEHHQHGFPFEDIATRFRRLEEHLEVIRGLWDPSLDAFSFDGAFETLSQARFVPKPDPRPRIIIGGRGTTKTPRLAARYADELNLAFPAPDVCADRRARVDAACEAIGRPAGSVVLSVMTGCLVGSTAAEFESRARRLQELSRDGRSLDEYVRSLEDAWVVGTPERAAEQLHAFAAAGVERVLLQHQLFDDLEMLDVVAAEIRPKL